MPLEKGKSKKVFHDNLRAELAAGKPLKQALAISYAQKGEKRFADGGVVPDTSHDEPSESSHSGDEQPTHKGPGAKTHKGDEQPTHRGEEMPTHEDAMFANGGEVGYAVGQHGDTYPSRGAAANAANNEMQQNPMAYMRYAQPSVTGPTAAAVHPVVNFAPETVTAHAHAHAHSKHSPSIDMHPGRTAAKDVLSALPPGFARGGEVKVEAGKPYDMHGIAVEVGKPEFESPKVRVTAGTPRFADGGAVGDWSTIGSNMGTDAPIDATPDTTKSTARQRLGSALSKFGSGAQSSNTAAAPAPQAVALQQYTGGPPIKLAHGGRVPTAPSHIPGARSDKPYNHRLEIFTRLSSKLHRFKDGGEVTADYVAPMIQQAGQVMADRERAPQMPVLHGVEPEVRDITPNMRNVNDALNSREFAAKLPTPHASLKQPGETLDFKGAPGDLNAGNIHIKPDPEQSLNDLEGKRQAALEAAKPGVGTEVRRRLANALLGFGHGQMHDYAAEDRAARGDINSEFDRQRKNLVSTPAEAVAIRKYDASSPESQHLTQLVSPYLHTPEGVSAAELHEALPSVVSLEGNARQRELVEANMAHQRNQEDIAKQHLTVEEQNARTNASRASSARGAQQSAEQDRHDRMELQAIRQLKNQSPQLSAAATRLTAAEGADSLLNDPQTANDPRALSAAAGEISRLLTGGADQHMADQLATGSVPEKISKAYQQLTGYTLQVPLGMGHLESLKFIVNHIKEASKAVVRREVLRSAHLLHSHLPPEEFASMQKDPVSWFTQGDMGESAAAPAAPGLDPAKQAAYDDLANPD